MPWTQEDLEKLDASIAKLETELQELRSRRAEMQRSINGGNVRPRFRLAAFRKGFDR